MHQREREKNRGGRRQLDLSEVVASRESQLQRRQEKIRGYKKHYSQTNSPVHSQTGLGRDDVLASLRGLKKAKGPG